MKISELAYELYKNDWLSVIFPKEKADIILQYYMDRNANLPPTYCNKEAGKYVAKHYTLEEYIEINGYNGAFYASYDEFMQDTYKDEAYMRKLFRNQWHLVNQYVEDRKETK